MVRSATGPRVRSVAFVTLSLLATFAGCREKPAPSSFNYSLSLGRDSEFPVDDRGSPLVLNGKEIGLLTSHGGVSLALPGDQWLSDPGTRLAVRISTTCGPTDVPFSVSLGRSAEERARKEHPESTSFLVIEPAMKPTMATIYVDNVDGKQEAAVTVGKLERREAAGARSTLTVPLGDCPEAREVRIGGEKVGELPPPRDSHAALIDVVGGHCYAMTVADYDRPEVAGVIAHEADKPQMFSGTRVLEVPRVSYLLELAPDKLTSTDGRRAFSQLLHSKGCR